MVNLTPDEQKLLVALQRADLDRKLVAMFERLQIDVDMQCRAAVPMVQVRRAQGQSVLLDDLITAFKRR